MVISEQLNDAISMIYVVFWFKNRGILPGLTFSNELIARDESQHVEFACWLYGQLNNKLSTEAVYAIVEEAVEIESRFWDDAFAHPLRGLNAVLMKNYVRFVADVLLKMLGLEPLFNTPNPLPYMENISLEGKSNFFERRVSEYKRAHVGKHQERQQLAFSTNEEF
ncbi:uncharacterized protein LOC129588885 [Paramacrobiotus metropolitanus]|uniref:uncharacterized protein LOC129588885 n=1 Tax=Paramacrobiotus metropolitanus TaxID=2943436 RepID=UPI0024465B3A|nr:uncharacterized protein LOC129588885 [Paramacrobiotus metropolitanus]